MHNYFIPYRYICNHQINDRLTKAFNRYLWLANTLMRFKRLSFEEIRQEWEKSSLYDGHPLNIRTFHLHKAAVEELFDVNIVCDASDGYRYFIEEESFLRKDGLRQWLLHSFNMDMLLEDSRSIRDRIIWEEVPGGIEYLSDVVEAIKGSKVIRLEYQAFYMDAAEVFHLRPYCLRLFERRWYVLGWMEEKAGLRHIALDRIKNLTLTNAGFKYPKDFIPEEYYRDSVGIWVDEGQKPERVVLRAYEQEIKYLQSLPLHRSQKLIARTSEYADFEYCLCINRDLVKRILYKGAGVKVIMPDTLATEISNEIARMNNNK